MNRLKITLGFFLLFGLLTLSQAQQKVYTTSGGEVIFSWADLQFNEQWVADNTNGSMSPSIVKTPTRFTCFFHVGEFVHLDLGNNVGIFSGFGLRNIGMTSDEILPTQYGVPTNEIEFQEIKVIRRAYSISVPLALKIGSFKDHFYIYGGGEIDYMFHYKEKYWRSHDRDGAKSKNKHWWPNQLEVLQPSLFAGIQFPKGLNLKAKYYINNFLNHEDTGNGINLNAVVSDLSKYEQSNVFYVALSYHFDKSSPFKKSKKEKEEEAEEVAFYF